MRAVVVALVALALGGCRYHIEHVREGQSAAPRAMAILQPGETSLAEAMAALGAPDGVEWTYDADVLVYDHWEIRRSHWELENPMTFVGRLTPQSLVGEAVTYVFFVAGRTGRILPTPPRPKAGGTASTYSVRRASCSAASRSAAHGSGISSPRETSRRRTPRSADHILRWVLWSRGSDLGARWDFRH